MESRCEADDLVALIGPSPQHDSFATWQRALFLCRRPYPHVKWRKVSSCAAILLLTLGTQVAAGPGMLSSFAFVQPDGSMRIAGKVIRLSGIFIPSTNASCHTFERPVRCGPRAALALEFKVSGDFVRCLPKNNNPDGSISAACTANGDDLGAWMIERGWAVATPDAPFEYTALERIARAKGIGIWGIPVEPGIAR